MENQFEKVIDIIIAVIIFFVFPVMYFTQRQETLIEQVVSTDTSDFINTVNSHGKLTKAMYEDYIAKLDDTNVICNVKLEHKKLALEPEYRFRTAQEIIDEQDKAYTGTNSYHYFPVSTDLPIVNDNADNSGLVMNTQTNESILAKSVHTTADPLHSHTDDCYVGAHKHGTNVLIENHVHTASCHCKGTVTGGVYHTPGGAVPYLHCSEGHSLDFGKYGYLLNDPNIATGVPCPELLCGFENGTYCNCYAPAIDFAIRDDEKIELKCHSCGQIMYMLGSPNGSQTLCYLGHAAAAIDRPNIFYVPEGDPKDPDSYYARYYKLRNFLMSLPLASGACSDYRYGSIPIGKFTLPLPYFGVFKGCPICNDYFVTADPLFDNSHYSGTIDLMCMKCNQLIARGFYNIDKGQHVIWLYKNGFVVQEIDTNYNDTNSLYYQLYNLAYGRANAGCAKEFHQGAGQNYTFDGSIGDKLAFTTISADASVINTFPLSSYTHHGCTYNAGKNTYCGLEGELKCHDIVKSITPTNPVQTVYVGEPLITTAAATYMDGSTGVVLCNADFTSSVPVKNKTVTLSYVNINKQTLTCTETVTVIPKTKVCINGHTYNLNVDGTDPGCPYCRAWLKSLEIFDPTDGKITIYRGTTLKENGVVLFATYFDGRKEYVENAYIDNLDRYYVGTQNVTISYKGKDVNLSVTTKRNIVQCQVCHHYYELYPDDTDPGCPYCKARSPVFTGNVLKYYSDTYSDEILKELYEELETYCFRAGDYFSVSVTNKSKTLGTKVLGFVIHGVPRTSIYVEKGGTVGEDTYGEHER